MEFKSITINVLVGASLAASSLSPALAHAFHPTIRPVECFDGQGVDEGFARITSSAHGHFVAFGNAGDINIVTTGFQINAQGFPAKSWSVKGHANPVGNQEFGFITVLKTPGGVIFSTSDTSSKTFNTTTGDFSATFDANALGFSGDQFQTITMISEGFEYQDIVNLTTGVFVNGLIPAVNVFHDGAFCPNNFNG